MKNTVNSTIIVKQVNNRPWGGAILPGLYDFSMKKNVIPKKFNASVEMHNMIIKNEMAEAKGCLLELAAGSGSLAKMIDCSIEYTGIDISLGLLKLAAKKFRREGFKNSEFYNCGAEELPFEENSFDCCVCNLSLNFFSDLEKVLTEAARVMKQGAVFFGSVPVPERNTKGSLIRGTLRTEAEIGRLFEAAGFEFLPINTENGALLYFNAVR